MGQLPSQQLNWCLADPAPRPTASHATSLCCHSAACRVEEAVPPPHTSTPHIKMTAEPNSSARLQQSICGVAEKRGQPKHNSTIKGLPCWHMHGGAPGIYAWVWCNHRQSESAGPPSPWRHPCQLTRLAQMTRSCVGGWNTNPPLLHSQEIKPHAASALQRHSKAPGMLHKGALVMGH